MRSINMVRRRLYDAFFNDVVEPALRRWLGNEDHLVPHESNPRVVDYSDALRQGARFTVLFRKNLVAKRRYQSRGRRHKMIVNDQAKVSTFLAAQARLGDTEARIETVETHISLVFLGPCIVFKLKRSIRFPYLDFSTPALRLRTCQKEVDLNRRTAPTLYKAARRITRASGGGLEFDGPGELVDAVVEMARFDENTLFDRLARRNELTPALLTQLARKIANFHDTAPIDRSRSGSAIMASALDINRRAMTSFDVLRSAEATRLNSAIGDRFSRHRTALDERARNGKVRRCHGDLHLRNICLVDNEPTLFDCIEFNESIATIDILYDLAFLVMDLWHQGLTSKANFTLNRYLDMSAEGAGLHLMPFFMAVRAAIRAHVNAAQANQASGERRERLQQEAKDYLSSANKMLMQTPAHLVAIGGLSGCGKSTVAATIADRIGDVPGARVLSSDRIRKCLHGVVAEARLPAQAYSPEISEQVYHIMMTQAKAVLDAGHSVVVDAVFDRPEHRERIHNLARKVGVRFSGIWLDAPRDVLFSRVERRSGDPSDATVAVVAAQLARLVDVADWTHVDSSGTPEETAEDVQAIINLA
ncbi:MAG: AAA family ATPase [Xanthobacteraceae bacterium]|nr:AAA family ATPase [Xanthobacteraceae bacterium]